MTARRIIVRWTTASPLVLAPLLFAVGCAPAEEATADPAADMAVREALDQRLIEYGEVAGRGDAEGLMDFWTEDLRVYEPGVDLDRSGMATFVREFFATGDVLGLDVRASDVFVHGDLAYQFGEYDEEIQAEGGEPTMIRNYFAARWERGEDGVWRIDRFVAGPREAPAEM